MRIVALLCLASATALPGIAAAEDMPFHLVPQVGALPAPTLALQYEVKVRVADRATMAVDLIDAGVDDKDAAMVAKLAGAHLAESEQSCLARLAMSEDAKGLATLDRVTLYVGEKQVVIERRDGELSVTSERVVNRFRNLV